MQALGDDDKAGIQETIDDEILKRERIEFRSTEVQQADGGRMSVQGELTIAGKASPIAFDLAIGDEARLTGRAVVKQSDWGIKPYSALFGALKVADEVEVVVDAGLQGHSP
jgi:polyisoprenoid-binding protein YceI